MTCHSKLQSVTYLFRWKQFSSVSSDLRSANQLAFDLLNYVVFQTGNAIVLLLNPVSVEHQNVRFRDATVFSIALGWLLVPKGFYLKTLNVRMTGLAIKAFEAKIVNRIPC